MIKIDGLVEKIIYRNDENAWTVALVTTEDGSLTVTGNAIKIEIGKEYTFEGDFFVHKKFGEQFSFKNLNEHIPTSKDGIIKYLSSGLIPFIGRRMAETIYKKFGDETLLILDKEPEKLLQIHGIGAKKFEKISEYLKANKEASKVMYELYGYGISPSAAFKIYTLYANETLNVIRENPYRIADEIKGIGFKTADSIALKLGYKKDSKERIISALKWTINYAVNDGHTYLPKDVLIKKSSKLLEINEDLIEDQIINLQFSKYFYLEKINDQINCYKASMYKEENYVAGKLTKLSLQKFELKNNIENSIKEIEERKNIKLAENQKEAVKEALTGGLTVITGGPGTGKTTTLKTIIDLAEKENLKTVLAAPTGRAAKRMEEATLREASTIHKLLEITPNSDYFEIEEIDGDLIIVDECSMVDLFLISTLLRAVKDNSRLVLVGDKDQLPSVGAGNVLSDIINSKIINVVYLNKIFRQEEGSLIVKNAHLINSGKMPLIDNKSKDFFFIQSPNVNESLNTIVDLVKTRLPDFKNYDSLKDIQVLSPTKKGLTGVDNLNKVLQENLNPQNKKEEIKFMDTIFRPGDKVMQIKNNYNLQYKIETENYHEEGQGIFNGELGFIESVDADSDTMTIVFDDVKKIEYQRENFSELTLAYASTVHKSQGSEFPAVIIPLHSAPFMLMTRNIIYTGITRASRMVVLVGEIKYLKTMVENNHQNKRYSSLDRKLIETMEKRKIYGFI